MTLHQQVRTLHVPTNSRASIHYLNHDEIRALLAAGPGVTAKSRRNRMLRRSLASARQVVGGGGVKATWVGSPLGIPRCRSSGSPSTRGWLSNSPGSRRRSPRMKARRTAQKGSREGEWGWRWAQRAAHHSSVAGSGARLKQVGVGVSGHDPSVATDYRRDTVWWIEQARRRDAPAGRQFPAAAGPAHRTSSIWSLI